MGISFLFFDTNHGSNNSVIFVLHDTCAYSGAQFTKYLSIYRKFIVRSTYDSDLNELLSKRFSSESDAVGLQATAGSATLSAST